MGDVEGGGEVHGAGVVGDEEPAGFEEDAEFHEGGLAGNFDDGVGKADEVGDFVNQLGVAGAADEEDPTTGGGVEAAGEFGKSFGGPAFGGAVFGGGVEAEDGAGVEAKEFAAQGGFVGAEMEFGWNGFGVGAEAGGKVKVPVDLVALGIEDFPFEFGFVDCDGFVVVAFAARFGNDFSEEGTAPVAPVTDAAGDAGTPDFPGGSGRVGEEEGGIELVGADGGDVGKGGERKKFVGVGGMAPEVVEFFRVENGDVGVGERLPEPSDSGERHDGVADPVGGADEEALWG